MKKTFILMIVLVCMFSMLSCQKPEEQQAEDEKKSMRPGPIVDMQAGDPHGEAPKTVFQVILPQEIKDQWSSVIIVVEDKKENKKQEVTAVVGAEFQIPDSDLTVKVGPFIPDFKMSGQTITSASGEPNNPSVGIAIMRDGEKIFPATGEWGWLYSKFPTIHSFQHERFGLVLKEGIKK